MTLADWNDIRSAGAGSGASAAAHVGAGPEPVTPASSSSAARAARRPGQLAEVAARAGARRSALPLSTQLTAGAVVVAAGAAGFLHDPAVSMLMRQDWVAAGAARAILTWPTGLAQVIVCLAGAAVLLAGIIASGGMRNVDEVRGWVMLVGGGAAVVGLVPTVVVLLMYLVIAALFVALLVLGAIAVCLLLAVFLADL